MTKLTVPKMIDLIQHHHPDSPATTLAHLLSNAQEQFVRKTKNNVRISVIDVDGQTVVGETEASPLSKLDRNSAFLWQFYKDDSVPTVCIKANSSVMYVLGIAEMDNAGDPVENYSATFRKDGSILLYDEEGEPLDDFQGDTDDIMIRFTKVPTQLVVSTYSSPDIDGEFCQGLVDKVISDLYSGRTDMPVQDRLMLSRHHKNLWMEAVNEGKRSFNMSHSDVPVTMQAAPGFEVD